MDKEVDRRTVEGLADTWLGMRCKEPGVPSLIVQRKRTVQGVVLVLQQLSVLVGFVLG